MTNDKPISQEAYEKALEACRLLLKPGRILPVLDIHNPPDYIDCANEALRLAEPEPEELVKELEVTNKLLNERQRVLDTIPACHAHGACVPHAIDWINRQAEREEAARALYDFISNRSVKPECRSGKCEVCSLSNRLKALHPEWDKDR